MLQKLIIRPINVSNVSMELKFDYRDTVLNRDYFIPNDYSQIILDKSRISKDTLPLKARFSGDGAFTYEWEDTDSLKNDIALAMQRHPAIKCPGNTNLKNPIFELINVTRKTAEDALTIKKKGLVFNMVNNTSLAKMRDVGFAFGYNPTGKTYSQIFIDLVDFVRGYLMQDVDKAISLLEGNLDEVFIVMKKAISLNIIAQRDGIYYVKSDVAGDSEDKLLMYLKENKGIFEQFVRKEVVKRDDLPADDYEKLVKDELAKYVGGDVKVIRRRTVDEEVEMAELKEEAKKLGVKGYHLIANKERLVAAIQKTKESIALAKGEELPLEEKSE
jgi:hypothetical protein